jgi:hypothetical protein
MGNKRRDNQVYRQEEAKERAKVRAAKSNVEQIARLDNLLGKGVGAVKERAMLAKEEKIPDKPNKMPKKKKAAAESGALPAVKELAKERRARAKSNKQAKK